jgi:hypothetical protein
VDEIAVVLRHRNKAVNDTGRKSRPLPQLTLPSVSHSTNTLDLLDAITAVRTGNHYLSAVKLLDEVTRQVA